MGEGSDSETSPNPRNGPAELSPLAPGKNIHERMAFDCNKIMKRNTVNIFKNTKDSEQ